MMFDSGNLEANGLVIILLITLVFGAIGAISVLASIRKTVEQGKEQLYALGDLLASRLVVQTHSPATTPVDPEDESYAAKKDANIPLQLRQLHNAWLHKAQRWEHIYYTLTILSVLFATLVATGDSLRILFPKDSTWFEATRTAVAIAAALTTGLLAAFNPYKIYEDYIGAWRIVNTAKLEYLMKKDLLLGYLVDQTRVAEESLRESRRYDARATSGNQTGQQQATETERSENQKKEPPPPEMPSTATMTPASSAAASPAPITPTTATPPPATPSIAATMPAASTTAPSTPVMSTPAPPTPTTSTTTVAAPATSITEVSQAAMEQTESPSTDAPTGSEGEDAKSTGSEPVDGSSKEHGERRTS